MFKFIKKLFTPKEQKDEHIELFEQFPISDIKIFDEQNIDKTFENETKKINEKVSGTKSETKWG
tara:strand:- start:150 stop:341 length:192 start_codon:yes stop_codon:yes gene_type:complete